VGTGPVPSSSSSLVCRGEDIVQVGSQPDTDTKGGGSASGRLAGRSSISSRRPMRGGEGIGSAEAGGRTGAKVGGSAGGRVGTSPSPSGVRSNKPTSHNGEGAAHSCSGSLIGCTRACVCASWGGARGRGQCRYRGGWAHNA